MKTIYLLMCFVSSLSCSAQLLTGRIVDSLNNPIPYSSISILNKHQGTNADIEGYFQLNIDNFPVNISVNNVGYFTKTISLDSTPNFLNIYLKEKIVILDEVVVRAEENRPSIYLGSPKNPKGITLFSADNSYEQSGLMLKNDNNHLYDNNSVLVSITIKILPKIIGGTKPDGSRQLRLRLYNIDKGNIGTDILNSNVFFTPKKSGKYRLVLPNPISIPPDGFIIAIEWIENQPFQHFKKEDFSIYGLLIYGHRIAEGERESYITWHYNPLISRWGYKKHVQGEKYYIPAFRLEIKEYK